MLVGSRNGLDGELQTIINQTQYINWWDQDCTLYFVVMRNKHFYALFNRLKQMIQQDLQKNLEQLRQEKPAQKLGKLLKCSASPMNMMI